MQISTYHILLLWLYYNTIHQVLPITCTGKLSEAVTNSKHLNCAHIANHEGFLILTMFLLNNFMFQKHITHCKTLEDLKSSCFEWSLKLWWKKRDGRSLKTIFYKMLTKFKAINGFLAGFTIYLSEGFNGAVIVFGPKIVQNYRLYSPIFIYSCYIQY